MTTPIIDLCFNIVISEWFSDPSNNIFTDPSNNPYYSLIETWDVGNVTDMSNAFYDASGFNQDISGWNTSNVTNMSNMFNGASTFDVNIRSWDVSSSTVLTDMFNGASTMDIRFDGFTEFGSTPTTSFFNITAITTAGLNSLINSWIADPSDNQFTDPTNSPYYGHISFWEIGNVTGMVDSFKSKYTFNETLYWDTRNVNKYA